jgi:uncharacterized protein (TIGR02266 family)
MVQPDDLQPSSRSPSSAVLSDGRHPPRRLRLQTPITFVSQRGTHAGLTENLGVGGLFIATRELCPPGERVGVSFTMPIAGLRLDAVGVVWWVRERASAADPERPSGMGLRFVSLSPDARHAVEAFLRQGAAVSRPHDRP